MEIDLSPSSAKPMNFDIKTPSFTHLSWRAHFRNFLKAILIPDQQLTPACFHSLFQSYQFLMAINLPHTLPHSIKLLQPANFESIDQKHNERGRVCVCSTAKNWLKLKLMVTAHLPTISTYCSILVQLNKSQTVTNCRCSPINPCSTPKIRAIDSTSYWLHSHSLPNIFWKKHVLGGFCALLYVCLGMWLAKVRVSAIVVLHCNGNCHYVNFMWYNGKKNTAALTLAHKQINWM